MKGLISLLIFFCCLSGLAQISDTTFFSDTITGQMSFLHTSIEVEDGIILSGYASELDVQQPYICKIDKTGELLWTTLDSIHLNIDCNSSVGGNFEIKLFEDGFIYGRTNYGFCSTFDYVWKVNSNTGVIAYAKPFYTSSDHKAFISDYDSTTYLMTYHTLGGYIATSENVKMAFMDKTTGDTLSTHFIYPLFSNPKWGKHGVAVDANKNIFYYQGDILIKLNKGNPNDILWKRTFSDSSTVMTTINHIYMDDEENLFLFGSENSTTSNAVAIKVDQNTGKQIWNTTFNSDYFLSNLVDKYGKLYLSFQKCCIGSTIDFYYAVKLDKTTGAEDWTVLHSIASLNLPNYQKGTTFGIDVDCNGDVYITGQHGGDLQVGETGLLKLDGSTGAKLYDKIIPGFGPINYISNAGKQVHVFENEPLILAEVQSLNSLTTPFFDDQFYTHSIAVDPLNGDILKVKGIGGENILISKTLDIIKEGDSLFVLKQIGKYVQVDLLNAQDSVLWTSIIDDSTYIQGGQLKITPSFVYVSSKTNFGYDTSSYDIGMTESIKMFQLSRLTGTIVNFKYWATPNAPINLLEMEANDSVAFLYYKQYNWSNVAKWLPTANSFNYYSTDYSSVNGNFKGQSNCIIDLDSSSLLEIGSANLSIRNKTTLNNTVLFSFTNPREYYDYYRLGDTVWMAGSNNAGNKLVTAFNLNTNSIIWEQLFGLGAIYKISSDGNSSLAIAGNEDSVVYVAMINKDSGLSYWENNSVLNQYTSMKLLDMKINKFNNSILLSGESVSTPQNSDLFITELTYYGDTLGNYFGVDQIDKKSFGCTIEIGPDSIAFIGGAFNHAIATSQGVIFKMQNNNCVRDINAQFDPCVDTITDLTAWVGSSYQWLLNGILIPGANNQLLTATQSGLYNCIVTDQCSSDTLIFGKYITLHDPSANPNGFDPISNSICSNGGLVPLTSASAGGLFSGVGVVGSSFDPQLSGEGQFILTYSIPNAIGCVFIDSMTIIVNDTSSSIVNVSGVDSVLVNSTVYLTSGIYQQNLTNYYGCDSLLTINAIVCQRDILTSGFTPCIDTTTLLTAWPGSSYQWYKNGLALPGETNQSLIVSSIGNYNCIVNDSCSIDSLLTGININYNLSGAPNVTITTLDTILCINDGPSLLNALPFGGSYQGSGVVGNSFDPQIAGVGQFILNYTYIDSNGCFGADSTMIVVNDTSSSAVFVNGQDSIAVNGVMYFSSGTYTQILLNQNGCDSILTLDVNLTYVGLDEILLNARIFPNPATDVLIIEGVDIIGQTIQIYDMTGKLVLSKVKQFFRSEIDLARFERGTYLVKVGVLNELIVLN